MNNETSFENNNEMFIIVAGVNSEKESLLVSPVSMLVLEFVGSVCKASSSIFFSEGVPSEIRSSGFERGLSGMLARVLSKVVR